MPHTTPTQAAAVLTESAETINGEAPNALNILAALIDIYDDAQSAAPEDRCYVPGALPDVLDMARKFLAAATPALLGASVGEPVELPTLNSAVVAAIMKGSYSEDQLRSILVAHMQIGADCAAHDLATCASSSAQAVSWYPIETAPLSGRGERPNWFLAWNGHHVGVCARWADEGYGETIADETDQQVLPAPTHYRPLPAPPSSSQEWA